MIFSVTEIFSGVEALQTPLLFCPKGPKHYFWHYEGAEVDAIALLAFEMHNFNFSIFNVIFFRVPSWVRSGSDSFLIGSETYKK